MKGYKIVTFKRQPIQITYSGIVYNPGQLYTQEASPIVANRGFHFYRKLWYVYERYTEMCWHRLLAVRSKGDLDTDGSMVATNALYVVRELTPAQALDTLQREYARETESNQIRIRCYVQRLYYSAFRDMDIDTPWLRLAGVSAEPVNKHRELWREAFDARKDSELMRAIPMD